MIFPPSSLDGLRPNSEWAKLPIFDRKGWKRVRFGEVVENVNETERDPMGAGIERFIGLEHLEPGSLHVRSWGNIVDGTTFTRRCRPRQVLFGKRRAYQRKVAVAEFDAVVSGDIYVFQAKKDKLLPELLPFLCMSEPFFQHAVGTSAGSLSPRTSWSSLADFEFDLPPVEQQRRIAEILLEVDKLVSKLTILREDAASWREMSLRTAFETGSARRSVPIQDTGIVQLGRQRAPKYKTGISNRPYLRVANVFDGFIDYSDVLEMDFDDRDFEKYRLKTGDILLNEGQSRELVGRCAIYDGRVESCCFQNTLIRYQAGKHILPEYAFAFFHHCFHAGVFAKIASQTTSIAHLGAERFGAIPMPVPPKDLQAKIVMDFQHGLEAQAAVDGQLNNVLLLRTRIANEVFP
jgi:type I restriction enzyme S subunit